MAEYIERQAAIIEMMDNDIDHAQGIDGREVVQILEDMPAADVVPVRHGKWKKIGEWGRSYRCNRCGNFLDFDGVDIGRGDANFCPNCGAKMDGGESDG